MFRWKGGDDVLFQVSDDAKGFVLIRFCDGKPGENSFCFTFFIHVKIFDDVTMVDGNVDGSIIGKGKERKEGPRGNALFDCFFERVIVEDVFFGFHNLVESIFVVEV